MGSLTTCSHIYRQLTRTFYVPATTSKIFYSTKKIPEDEIVKDDDSVDLKNLMIDNEVDEAERAARIAKLRNKSRLLPQDRRRALGQKPYDEPHSWVHLTLSYQRKMYARFGESSGVDPRLLFETPEERADREEYERVAFPHTVPEMMATHEQQEAEKEKAVRLREEQIAKNLSKLDKWKEDLEQRLAKKEAEARAAKEKRERMIEDIRRQFGFRLDPRGAKFKELVDQKEQEEAKARKKLKKQRRQEQLLEKLKQDTAQLTEEETQKTKQADKRTKNKNNEKIDVETEESSSNDGTDEKAGNDSDSDDEKDTKKKKGK